MINCFSKSSSSKVFSPAPRHHANTWWNLQRARCNCTQTSVYVFKKFAAINVNDAEGACHRLFVELGYAAPVKIHYIHLADQRRLSKFPLWNWVTGRSGCWIQAAFGGCFAVVNLTHLWKWFWLNGGIDLNSFPHNMQFSVVAVTFRLRFRTLHIKMMRVGVSRNRRFGCSQHMDLWAVVLKSIFAGTSPGWALVSRNLGWTLLGLHGQHMYPCVRCWERSCPVAPKPLTKLWNVSLKMLASYGCKGLHRWMVHDEFIWYIFAPKLTFQH